MKVLVLPWPLVAVAESCGLADGPAGRPAAFSGAPWWSSTGEHEGVLQVEGKRKEEGVLAQLSRTNPLNYKMTQSELDH